MGRDGSHLILTTNRYDSHRVSSVSVDQRHLHIRRSELEMDGNAMVGRGTTHFPLSLIQRWGGSRGCPRLRRRKLLPRANRNFSGAEPSGQCHADFIHPRPHPNGIRRSWNLRFQHPLFYSVMPRPIKAYLGNVPLFDNTQPTSDNTSLTKPDTTNTEEKPSSAGNMKTVLPKSFTSRLKAAFKAFNQ